MFERTAPVVLEIGSGMGETTAAIAQQNPEIDFIAIEVHGPGVGSLLKKIDALELKNLRVIRHDAVEVLEQMIRRRRAGRHPPFLSRPLAEEAPPQAPPGAAALRRARRAQARARRLLPRRHRLAGVRGRRWTRCFRPNALVRKENCRCEKPPRHQVRAPRHRPRPPGARPAIPAPEGIARPGRSGSAGPRSVGRMRCALRSSSSFPPPRCEPRFDQRQRQAGARGKQVGRKALDQAQRIQHEFERQFAAARSTRCCDRRRVAARYSRGCLTRSCRVTRSAKLSLPCAPAPMPR